MPVSLYLLAREWHLDSVEPGSDASGFWSGDIGTLDLTGLLTTPGSPPSAFGLDETSGRALLRPNTPAGAVRDVDQPAFYFEVVAVSTQHLQLALWMWHPPVSKHQHKLTFAWVPLGTSPIASSEIPLS
ncbi:hypothetical protein [Hymenobacter aerophilus]|uniref:hypothetical protein n=1 Tax=Hymenobacter aerophilus TaxID=119644 RepID=UPI0012FB53AE|nr:hypothetical protein [Hymenobacter aerophilus]